jgi:hypothetical protein
MEVRSNALFVKLLMKAAKLLVVILQRVIQVFLQTTLLNKKKEINVLKSD